MFVSISFKTLLYRSHNLLADQFLDFFSGADVNLLAKEAFQSGALLLAHRPQVLAFDCPTDQ